MVTYTSRWNSYYDAINCIVENIDKIDDICIKLELVSFSKPREVGFLKEYCKVIIIFIYKYTFM